MVSTLAPIAVSAAGSAVVPTTEQCLFDKHNEERVARGIAPLVPDSGLSVYAREWSFEMELTGFRHSDLSFPGTWRRGVRTSHGARATEPIVMSTIKGS